MASREKTQKMQRPYTKRQLLLLHWMMFWCHCFKLYFTLLIKLLVISIPRVNYSSRKTFNQVFCLLSLTTGINLLVHLPQLEVKYCHLYFCILSVPPKKLQAQLLNVTNFKPFDLRILTLNWQVAHCQTNPFQIRVPGSWEFWAVLKNQNLVTQNQRYLQTVKWAGNLIFTTIYLRS